MTSSDNIFQFSHESVDAVTITDENGNARTFIDAHRVAEVMNGRVDAEAMPLTISIILGGEMMSTDEKRDAAERIFTLKGQGEAYDFVAGFSMHMEDVSRRLAQGLPAHEGDAPDEEAVDAEVERFAQALDNINPDDFKA